MKELLFGAGGGEANPEVVAQLAQEVYTVNLLTTFVSRMPFVDFEVCRRPYDT